MTTTATIYVPFNSSDALVDTHYLGGMWLDSVGVDHTKMTKTIRDALAAAAWIQVR